MRFLLVDRILELESGKRATGVKNVALSEDFLAHHFPHSPIMPGALITEALVQLASWIVQESTAFQKLGLVAGFDKLKFHRMVRPGDQLRLEANIVSSNAEKADVKGRAYCDGKLVTAARFSLACVNSEPLQSGDEARRIFGMIKY